MKLAEMGARAGLDPYSDKALRSMFEAPLKFAMPDGTLPMFNDSGAASLWSNARYYEAAYARYQDRPWLVFWARQPAVATPCSGGTSPARDHSARPAEPSVPGCRLCGLASRSGQGCFLSRTQVRASRGWHGHYDKLGHVLFARGGVLGVDPGTQSYAAPTHTTWDKVTLSHNTVVVDEKTQGRRRASCIDSRRFRRYRWQRRTPGRRMRRPPCCGP